MEPSITASLDFFAPFGSNLSNGKAQLKGSFGNAVLDNIPDYYSQLLTKVITFICRFGFYLIIFHMAFISASYIFAILYFQSNLSNPPTPPSSLPPTPPPSVQHKLPNGMTTGEDLSKSQQEKEPTVEPMGISLCWTLKIKSTIFICKHKG